MEWTYFSRQKGLFLEIILLFGNWGNSPPFQQLLGQLFNLVHAHTIIIIIVISANKYKYFQERKQKVSPGFSCTTTCMYECTVWMNVHKCAQHSFCLSQSHSSNQPTAEIPFSLCRHLRAKLISPSALCNFLLLYLRLCAKNVQKYINIQYIAGFGYWTHYVEYWTRSRWYSKLIERILIDGFVTFGKKIIFGL